MTQKIKRTLAAIITVVMILTVIPISGLSDMNFESLLSVKASAEENHIAPTGKCGDNVYWTFDKNTGLMVISGTGDMYDYIAGKPVDLSRKCLFYGSDLKKVIIEEGVTSIGEATFTEARKLNCVIIPESVNSIGYHAFGACEELCDIEIPENVTSIGAMAFWCCSKIESISIPKKITSIEHDTFFACFRLRNITIPNSVKYIEACAFSFCNNLTDVYFDGTKEQWDSIVFDWGNEDLLNATIHFADSVNINSVSINDISIDYKSNAKLNPTIEADNGAKYTVEYTSSNTKVATVDDNGNVYGAGKGDTIITCTVTDSNGNSVSDTSNVTVSYNWWQWIIKIVLFGWIWY